MTFVIHTEHGDTIKIGRFDNFPALKEVVEEHHTKISDYEYQVPKQSVYYLISMLRPIYNILKNINEADIARLEDGNYLSTEAVGKFDSIDRHNRFIPIASNTPLVTYKTIRLYSLLIVFSEMFEANNNISITLNTEER